MVQYDTACFFNTDGQLLGKVGGQIAAEGSNGDRRILDALGTEPLVCAGLQIEPHPPFPYQIRVCLVQPGFPTAFLVYHYPNFTFWTGDHSGQEDSFFQLDGLASGGQIPLATQDSRLTANRICRSSIGTLPSMNLLALLSSPIKVNLASRST